MKSMEEGAFFSSHSELARKKIKQHQSSETLSIQRKEQEGEREKEKNFF